MPNDKITAVGANIAEKAAMIWNVADMLRGFPFEIFYMRPMLWEIGLVSAQNRLQFCKIDHDCSLRNQKVFKILYHDKSRNTIFRQNKMPA